MLSPADVHPLMGKLHYADRIVFFRCPGCLCAHGVVVDGNGAWGFNGADDSPTFSPSILVYGTKVGDNPAPGYEAGQVLSPRCHSFVENGWIRFLDDSEHDLAGKTVELPDWL